MEYELKLFEFNDIFFSYVCIVLELEILLFYFKCNEEEYFKKILEFIEENNVLIKLVKMKKDYVNSDCESDCENIFV